MSNIQWQDMHNVQQRAINTIRKKKHKRYVKGTMSSYNVNDFKLYTVSSFISVFFTYIGQVKYVFTLARYCELHTGHVDKRSLHGAHKQKSRHGSKVTSLDLVLQTLTMHLVIFDNKSFSISKALI